MLKNFCLLAVVLVVCIIASELIIGTVWSNPFADSGASSYVELRQQKRDVDFTLNRSWLDIDNPQVRFRTDASGYIFPSNQHSNPDIRIGFLGGSTTECSYVQEDKRFPALVGKLLTQAHGLKVNTLNAGRSGNTSHDAVNLLFNKLSRENLDYVVLMEATNDAGVLQQDPEYASRAGGELSFGAVLQWVAVKLSAKSHIVSAIRSVITQHNNNAGEAVAARARLDERTAPPSQLTHTELEKYESRLSSFVGVARALNIIPILMTQPLAEMRNELTPSWASMSDQQMMNTAIRKVAAENNVQLVDLESALYRMADFQDDPISYLYDAMHVTDKGSEFYARVITEEIGANLLKRQ